MFFLLSFIFLLLFLVTVRHASINHQTSEFMPFPVFNKDKRRVAVTRRGHMVRRGSATGPPWVLVVDGQVEEGHLRGAGVPPPRGPPVRLPGVAAAHRQVRGQRDLGLEPHLPVLRETWRSGTSRRGGAPDSTSLTCLSLMHWISRMSPTCGTRAPRTSDTCAQTGSPDASPTVPEP